MLTIFDKIPELSAIPNTFQPYDNTVQKNVNTVFQFPTQKADLYPEPNVFFSNKEWNANVDRIYENLDYLNSQSRIWNSFIPGALQENLYENQLNQTILQNGVSGELILADEKVIRFLSGGEVVQTLDCSPLDNFFQIKEIKITNDRFYLVDRNLVFVWDYPSFDFQGFFGGFGGPTEKTKFNGPCSITANEDYIFVADTQNRSIKIYDCNFQFIFRGTLPIHPTAIEVNENYLFVAGNSTKLYRFDLSDFRCFNVYDLPFSGITKIRNDFYQDGFLYIINSAGKAIKYTQDGLVVGNFRDLGSTIIDVAKDETTLFVYQEDGTIKSYLDHSFLYSILSEECQFIPSGAYIADGELNSSYLSYNKSIEYMQNDLQCYADSVTGTFVNIVSEFQDAKLAVEIAPTSCVIPDLDKSSYFGKDDPFVWEIMKRGWEALCIGFEQLENCYKFGIANPPPFVFDCVPLSALRIDKPQKPSSNAFPLTIKEIQPQFNKFNFAIFSGDNCKSWCDIECFFGNNTSSCTTWNDMANICDVVCLSAVRWCDFNCPSAELPCLVDVFEPSSSCSAITVQNNGNTETLSWNTSAYSYDSNSFSIRWEDDRWKFYELGFFQKELLNNLFDPTDGWENTDNCIIICNGDGRFICHWNIQIIDNCGETSEIISRQEILTDDETFCKYEGDNWFLCYNECGFWDLSSKINGDIWSYPITDELSSANPSALDPDNDMIFSIDGLRSKTFNLPKDMIVSIL